MVSSARKVLILAVTSVLLASPLIAAGGGGGGGSMPSDSAPTYDPAVEYQKGVEAFKAQQYKDAAIAFKRVTNAVPKNAPAQYLLGASYIALGDYKKAHKPLEAAVKYDPKMIDARRDLGIAAAKIGKPEIATQQMDALNALKVACTATCADGVRLDDAIAKVGAAISGGKQARVAIKPDIKIAAAKSADASYVAAVSLINEKRYADAITLLDDALWTAGPHPDILTYLGFANRKLHRYDAAKFYYRQALTVAPNHLGALEYYGELKLELGDIDGAKAHLARLDRLCGFGCAEADELRSWIKGTKTSAS